MEPSYGGESAKAARKRRIARTRVAAAVASGVTFGAAVAGFAVHDRSAKTTTVSATTPSTTLDQSGGSSSATDDDRGFGSGAVPADPGSRFTTRTRGS